MPCVVLENLTKTFVGPTHESVCAVNAVSVTVADRELLALVGPSGCGKTTLLRLLAGLETAEQGSIRFDGQAVQHQPPQHRDVAMVFQSPALFPHLTGFANIAFGLKLRGVRQRDTARRVHEMAELLGITHCLPRRPAELSGGERQRIALGRALAHRPKLLLLDEPFSQLDAPLRAQLQTEIQNLRAQLNLTLIYVTHDQADALALGDRVAVMGAGHLQQIGHPRDIYDAPANRFVAGFIGTPAMNFLPGTLEPGDGHLVFIGTPPGFRWRVPAERSAAFGHLAGQTVVLGFRPEHLAVADGARPIDGRPTISAKLKLAEFTGPESILQFCVGEETFHVRAGANIALTPGQNATLAFDLGNVRVFGGTTGELLL